jgi:hypothetical protein
MGMVAYEKWKDDTADIQALDDFLERYAAPAEKPTQGPEEIAALINAYNAFTIRWILEHGDFKIEYLDYNWGLNDQSGRGRNFRAGILDRLFGNAK